MTDRKGERLFVNLGASQTRRRLRGFGHGVRKVEAVGRNQALVIHTATGRHLQELEQQFADVGCAADERALSQPIENLPNLGPASGGWLREVGLRTVADLERIGPEAAFALVKRKQPRASLNLLWAMSAGLAGQDWRTLSVEARNSLRRQVPTSD